jgi:hypothetical protein
MDRVIRGSPSAPRWRCAAACECDRPGPERGAALGSGRFDGTASARAEGLAPRLCLIPDSGRATSAARSPGLRVNNRRPRLPGFPVAPERAPDRTTISPPTVAGTAAVLDRVPLTACAACRRRAQFRQAGMQDGGAELAAGWFVTKNTKKMKSRRTRRDRACGAAGVSNRVELKALCARRGSGPRRVLRAFLCVLCDEPALPTAGARDAASPAVGLARTIPQGNA